MKFGPLRAWFAVVLLIAVSRAAGAVPHPRGATVAPLKVFILAGQSNMQGHAHVRTIPSMKLDPRLVPLHDAMIGPDGKPGGDPHLLYGDYTPTGPRDHSKGTGAIRAFGDHKGSGLAFMCELLGGSLSGNGATDPDRGKFANGMLSFYVDPKVLDPEGFFPRDVAKYVSFVKSSKPTAAGAEVLVPGEVEARTRAERLANGVPLPDDTWAAIVETARSVGLDERRIQQATM